MKNLFEYSQNCVKFDVHIFVSLYCMCMDRNDPFLYCYAITGSCKEPSKKPKGGSNESEQELESKPFLSKSLVILVKITYSVH